MTVVLTNYLDDLAHFLENWLQTGDREQVELVRLIEALERKDTALRRQLARETQPSKRRHLEIELAVTRLQHSKGLARLLERQRRGE